MIAKNLIVNGSSRFIGDAYGNLVGTINGHTVEKDVPSNALFTDTTYSVVAAGSSTTAGGLMSQADKTKLNGISASAEVNQNAFSNIVVGSTTIAADSKTDSFTIAAGSNVTILPDANNDKITISATDTTYSVVSAGTSTTAGGLMSQADKTKLNGIATGAEVNQNAFSNITVGSTTIAADSKTDTLTLVAGSNVTLTPDATNDKVTIAATDIIPSAYCETAGGTAAKVASCTGYVLRQYNYIQVIIVNANTYNGAITLNINGTGAKTIRINGSDSSSSNKTLPAGSYMVYYNGTQYCFNTSFSMPGYIDYARYINMTSTTNKMFIGGATSSSNGYKSLYFNSNVYIDNGAINITGNSSGLIIDGNYGSGSKEVSIYQTIEDGTSPTHSYGKMVLRNIYGTESGSGTTWNALDTITLDSQVSTIEIRSKDNTHPNASISGNHIDPHVALAYQPYDSSNITKSSVFNTDGFSFTSYDQNGSNPDYLMDMSCDSSHIYINSKNVDWYVASDFNIKYGNIWAEKIAGEVNLGCYHINSAVKLYQKIIDNGTHGLYSDGYWNGSSFVSNPRWLISRDTGNNNVIAGNTYITGNLITQTSTANTANVMRIEHNGFGGTSIDMEVSSTGVPGIYSSKYWNGSSAQSSPVWMMYRDNSGFVRVRSCSGTNSMPIVTTSDSNGKRLSGGHCNTSTQLALYGQWGTTGTTYAYRYVAVTTSDPRLKENIEPTKFNALELINKINLYSFDWKNDDTPHYDVGYIATELYELDHNLAIKPEDESEGYWGVNDYYMSGVQTKAIQELSAENNELRNKITSLEARIASLEELIK